MSNVKSKVKSQAQWLRKKGYASASVSGRCDISEVVAKRFTKHMHGAEAKILQQQIITHLVYGELSIAEELEAAITNATSAIAARRHFNKVNKK